MFGSELYVSLVIGVVLSLLYVEKTGILPAGLVVPGYLALVFDQPAFILGVLLVSFLTYFVVTYGVARFTLLYGRRKFAAMLIVGITLKLIFDYFYPVIPFEMLELRGMGIIVPGLIANTLQKQGFVHTMGSTFVLTAMTFAITFSYSLL